MALGWFTHLAGDSAVAWSGGPAPDDDIDEAAVAAMGEVGIDIRRLPRRPLPATMQSISPGGDSQRSHS